ncbi:MAG: beta-galactosidase [Muribaculaceae bacterium]|nr:beta-galactosidase [Muribaculaceae bacterium]
MKLKDLIKNWRALIIICALCALSVCDANAGSKKDSFQIGEGSFLLNGQPFIVKAAELHYPRIPQEYWDQRIKMCKSLGMNAVCLYTFWNVHETQEGIFDFTGQNDIRKFILLCQENGLKVILRPGPYVCAEWEMGGLPWWLLKKKDIKLRDNDPYFMERVKIFEEALADQVKDLTIDNEGPIIMIQVENEYGSYGENKPYVSNIRDILRGLYGENVVMFQCDWSSNFILNGLDDLVWTMNFGTGADVDSQFADLKKLRPSSPLMCSEFWSGWFDKWGSPHETRPADEMIKGIDEMLEKNISFSLYMTHGGTNWGHWAGANSPGYSPDVTSYDYDAPINESGNPTEKYWMLRKTLQKYAADSLPVLPGLIEPIKVDTFSFTQIAPLWDNLPQPITSEFIQTMEQYNQGYGSILYSSELPKGVEEGAVLHVNAPHDYAQIFIGGKYIGKLDRRLGETQLLLPKTDKNERLDILVEAMGRINFGIAIKDFKGITEDVFFTETVDSVNLTVGFDYWNVYLLPDYLEFYTSMNFQSLNKFELEENGRYPRGVYKTVFTVDKPSDTFLNFETWGKGLVYLNGHPLGRIWEIGPQQTLYVPGPWLKEGENELLVFDILGPREYISFGNDKPVIDKLQGDALKTHRAEGESLYLGDLTPVFGGAFAQGNGWKRQIFNQPAKGHYLIIEALTPGSDVNYVSIAEFYALDSNGERINRETWSIDYADSEDLLSGNNSADKIFDLQESTFWKSEDDSNYPQRIVINLGKEETITGIEYLPRVENGSPGIIKDYRIYITETVPQK